MSKLADLIKELCPDGVEYKTLGELGTFYGGLSGKSKNDFNDGNALYVTYMNVFSNLAVDTTKFERVNVGENEKQNYIQYGDILFTGSSETRDECGMSAVVVDRLKERVYLNSFSFGLRLHSLDTIMPEFAKYLFRSNAVRKSIVKTASGVTRFNVSKTKMKNVRVPVPPLPVQCEIVRILDNFTALTSALTSALTAELTAQRKRYSGLLNSLLSYEGRDAQDGVLWKKLGDIATEIYRGAGIKRDEVTEEGIQCVRYGEIYTSYNIWFDTCISHTDEAKITSKKYFEKGDILFAITGESVEEIAKSCAYVGDEKCLAGGDIVVMKHEQNPKYLAYALATTNAQMQKSKGKVKSKVVHSSIPAIKEIIVPIPSLEEQQRIVDILDRFDKMCNDLSEGLPAEIAARQKQYEYYRDKLLTFKEKKA